MTSRSSLSSYLFLPFFVLLTLLPLSCGDSDPSSVGLGWTPDSPATYRVSVSSESRFSGATSDVEAATDLTATFRVNPVSESEAEVQVVYLAAEVADDSGDMVALSVDDLSGREATVLFDAPGVVSSVEGDAALTGADIPLISTEEVIRSLFPPLPEGSFRPADTWTGDSEPPFENLGGEPLRMRYVVNDVTEPDGANPTGATANIEGYELSLRPRTFSYETLEGGVTGEGSFDVEFEGELEEGSGYQNTERTTDFDTDFIRLEGGGYANGNLHLTSTTTVERLNVTEQFGTGL